MFGNNISGDIIETKQKLARHLARLEELKQLVLATEQEVKRLKDKLIQYESVKPLSAGPIEKCPQELLSIIFKYFILDRPSHVRRLLPVCRRWYDLIIQDPQMWNTIRIVVPYHEWDVESRTQSIKPLIRSCLERSRSALLHVDLNLTHLDVPRDLIVERLYQGFWKASEDAGPESTDLLFDWLDDLDYEDLLNNDNFIAECIPDHVFDLIDLISGQNGENMERWQTLKIAFPMHPELAPLLWPKLLHPTLSLSDIQFTNLEHLRDLDANDPLPFFESTKCARVSDCGDWHMLSRMFPTSLRELNAEISSELAFFGGLASFINLTKLCIETVYIPSLRPGEDAGDCAIFLPVLQEFQLIGEFSSVIERVGFHFPILKDLILEWGAHVQAKPWLPAVQPKRLRWDVNPIRFEVIKKVTEGVLRDLLLRYTTTKELRVPAFMRAVLLGLLVELSSDDTLPGIWEVVSFHSASGILEVLQVKDIIGSRK